MSDSILVEQAPAEHAPLPPLLVADAGEGPAKDETPGTRRNLALTILAVLAVVFALEWARAFFISMLLGILFAYTLNSLVVWLQRLHVPRLLGAPAS